MERIPAFDKSPKSTSSVMILGSTDLTSLMQKADLRHTNLQCHWIGLQIRGVANACQSAYCCQGDMILMRETWLVVI